MDALKLVPIAFHVLPPIPSLFGQCALARPRSCAPSVARNKESRCGRLAEAKQADVAIYVHEDRVTEVMLALPLSFDVQPFPFEDSPNGPKTNIMRYSGPWTDENDKAVRRLQRLQIIRRFSRDTGEKPRRPKK